MNNFIMVFSIILAFMSGSLIGVFITSEIARVNVEAMLIKNNYAELILEKETGVTKLHLRECK